MNKDINITPKERVERALRGEQCDKIPFTVYECMIPQCAAERTMRNRGLCIVNRKDVFKTHRPNIKTTDTIYWEGGKEFQRTVHETPHGTLTSLNEAAGFTRWHHERMFKTPDDYKAILAYIQDEHYEACYEEFVFTEKQFGHDGIFRAGFGLEPLQTLISGNIMAMEDFCIQWMDNRDEILKLYHAIVENRRSIYTIVAESPALIANYGGNVVPEIIGLDVFEEYYVQHYNEAAEIMHKHGKLIGCHFDANCKLLSKAIARTGLDYIEAFTPAPDTDMTLAQAHKAWPDKVLWINFPSSIHLQPDERVASAAVNMLDELSDVKGIIIGITEDIPSDRWQGSCTAIMNGLDRHAEENPGLYNDLEP